MLHQTTMVGVPAINLLDEESDLELSAAKGTGTVTSNSASADAWTSYLKLHYSLVLSLGRDIRCALS
jgi:hypothetical protein